MADQVVEPVVPVVPTEPVTPDQTIPIDKVEIEDMMSWFDGNKPAESAVPEVPVVPQAPVAVPPVQVQSTPIEPVAPVVPVTPDPVVPPAKTNEEILQEQLLAAQQEMSRLAGLLAANGMQTVYPTQQQQAPAQAPVQQVPPAQTAPAQQQTVPESQIPDVFKSLLTPKEYLNKEQLDKVIDKPELINEAIHQSRTELVESFAQALPTMINMAVNRQLTISRAVTSFYETNNDLLPHAEYVQLVLGEQERSNPTKTYAEIFQLTADESRKRLGLQKPVVAGSNVPPSQTGQASQPGPAFAGGKGGNSTPIAPNGGKAEWFDPAASDMLDGIRPH